MLAVVMTVMMVFAGNTGSSSHTRQTSTGGLVAVSVAESSCCTSHPSHTRTASAFFHISDATSTGAVSLAGATSRGFRIVPHCFPGSIDWVPGCTAGSDSGRRVCIIS
jgi:hypothetical protein